MLSHKQHTYYIHTYDEPPLCVTCSTLLSFFLCPIQIPFSAISPVFLLQTLSHAEGSVLAHQRDLKQDPSTDLMVLSILQLTVFKEFDNE
jgi:hypothetical protein